VARESQRREWTSLKTHTKLRRRSPVAAGAGSCKGDIAMADPKGIHQSWSSRFTFIMASVGAAVGLGNFWRFPYIAGENGGGAFVLIYILIVAAIAVPLVMSELMIGRRGGLSAVDSAVKVAREAGAGTWWAIIGWFGMLAAFLILTFYSVVAGWILAYIPIAASGEFLGTTGETAGEAFGALVSDPGRLIFWHSVFMVITIFIVARGLTGGLELAASILMPLFFLMLLSVLGYAIAEGAFMKGVSFLFNPDFSAVNAQMILAAIGQAFFSVSVGVGIMLTYGAYLTKHTHIPNATITIAFSDTLVAIIAGLAIFPIVFAVGLEPDSGPSLIFETLPVAFGNMPAGQYLGTVFFVLAFFAAVTSSMAMLEIATSWAEDRGFKRLPAAIGLGVIAWIIGAAVAMSFSDWADVRPLGFIPYFADHDIFSVIETIAESFMMPVGGILISIFAGWVMSRDVVMEELRLSGWGFKLWRFLVRYVAPIAVTVVLVTGLMPNDAAEEAEAPPAIEEVEEIEEAVTE
jgi:NSS family neurotransmitter:Na+ symporter